MTEINQEAIDAAQKALHHQRVFGMHVNDTEGDEQLEVRAALDAAAPLIKFAAVDRALRDVEALLQEMTLHLAADFVADYRKRISNG